MGVEVALREEYRLKVQDLRFSWWWRFMSRSSRLCCHVELWWDTSIL